MMQAECACGSLTLGLPGPTATVAACHCLACQRRTGSLFGVGAYYPATEVQVSGDARAYVRQADSGATLTFSFCPRCGSTVFWTSDRFPSKIGVAVGAIADPTFPPPKNSLWETSKHSWLSIGPATGRFNCGLDPD